MAGAATLGIVYAIEPQRENDPVLEAAEKGIECLSDIVNAGSYLVDSIPICRHWTSVDALYDCSTVIL